MEKKAAYILTKEEFMIFPKLIIIALLILIVYVMLNTYINRDIDTGNFDAFLLTQKFIYSDNCIAYNDGVRTYPGVIDSTKFTDSRIAECASYPQGEGQGAVLTLFYLNETEIKKISINQPLADLSDFCNVKNKNFNCYVVRKYILLMEDQIKTPTILQITIINKNE